VLGWKDLLGIEGFFIEFGDFLGASLLELTRMERISSVLVPIHTLLCVGVDFFAFIHFSSQNGS